MLEVVYCINVKFHYSSIFFVKKLSYLKLIKARSKITAVEIIGKNDPKILLDEISFIYSPTGLIVEKRKMNNNVISKKGIFFII
jgi:hypothetical protein